jgi:hypothetical protein
VKQKYNFISKNNLWFNKGTGDTNLLENNKSPRLTSMYSYHKPLLPSKQACKTKSNRTPPPPQSEHTPGLGQGHNKQSG